MKLKLGVLFFSSFVVSLLNFHRKAGVRSNGEPLGAKTSYRTEDKISAMIYKSTQYQQ